MGVLYEEEQAKTLLRHEDCQIFRLEIGYEPLY